MNDLKGKKAVITGGAMGIGLAVCKRLIKEGCDITIWDLNEQALKQAHTELKSTGSSEVYAYQCNVADYKRVQELVDQANKDMGQIDILINNAAFVRHGKFWEQPVENAVMQMDINVNSLFYSIHAVLPDMLERDSGHVVNVSSGVAFASAPGFAAYTTSKWAVWGLTDVLRLEILAEGKTGVKLSSVHPGNIVSGMFEGFSLNWLGSLISPPIKDHDEIAKAIVQSALKKGKHIVAHPKGLYLPIILRGLIPDKLMGKLALLFGLANGVKGFEGRKGMVHSRPEKDQ